MDGITSDAQINTSLRFLEGVDRSTVDFAGFADGVQSEFDNLLDAGEQLRVQEAVRNSNRELQINGRHIKQTMDKDDYLKLLIAQLQHQDPTSPMQDKEFIAQMAQFSSLEQMTNMSAGFQSLANMLSSGQATSMLGKQVEVVVGENIISGFVEEVTRGDYPQVLVDGTYYDVSDVSRIREYTAAAAPTGAVRVRE